MTLAQMEDMLEQAKRAQEEPTASGDQNSDTTSEPAQMAVIEARLKTAKEQLIGSVLQMVTKWDLTEDDGETPILLEEEALMQVPTNVFTAIIKAVNRHQSAGDSGKA